jgi:hypothetical protein
MAWYLVKYKDSFNLILPNLTSPNIEVAVFLTANRRKEGAQ